MVLVIDLQYPVERRLGGQGHPAVRQSRYDLAGGQVRIVRAVAEVQYGALLGIAQFVGGCGPYHGGSGVTLHCIIFHALSPPLQCTQR